MFPYDYVKRAAALYPNRTAVSDGDSSISFSDLIESVEALGAGLVSLTGIDRPTIGVIGPNTLDQLMVILAVHAIRGIYVPLNYRNAPAQTARQIEASAPDLLFVDHEHLEKIKDYNGIAISNANEAGVPNVADTVKKFLGRKATPADVATHDIHAYKFTGGSTGQPKAVVQAFRVQIALIQSMLVTFNFQEDDCFLCAAPISHGAGAFMLPLLAAGGQVRLLRKSDVENVLDALNDGVVTATFLPPTMIYALMDLGKGKDLNFGALRQVVYGAAPMPEARVADAHAFFNGKLAVVYGQTEMPVIMTALTSEELGQTRRFNTVGRVTRFCDVRVVKPGTWEPVPAGEIGEVVGKSDLSMIGYLNNSNATKEVMFDGWLRTGDLGSLDESGFLEIKGRLRDMIISGGFNIYPREVETLLIADERVAQCVAFGRTDPKWGERLEIAVQPKPGSEVEAGWIRDLLREQAGVVFVPKRVHIFEQLPMTSVGKVDVNAVRNLTEEEDPKND